MQDECLEVSYRKPRTKYQFNIEYGEPAPITGCPHCGSTVIELPEGRYDCGYSRSVYFDNYIGNYVAQTTTCLRTARKPVVPDDGLNWIRKEI